jgi:hypothetical protein
MFVWVDRLLRAPMQNDLVGTFGLRHLKEKYQGIKEGYQGTKEGIANGKR